MFDSYDIHIPFDSYASCKKVGFDAETKKATFLIFITTMDGKSIESGKITFSVKNFLSHKSEFNSKLVGIDLQDGSSSPDTQQISQNSRGGSGNAYKTNTDNSTVLVPSESQYSPVSGATVTAIGYIDGQLHIQVYFENIFKTDNHGYLYFRDSSGNVVSSIASLDFWDDEQKGSYQEYIFDIQKEDLGKYEIYGYFVTCEGTTEGNWKVTF